MESTNLNLDWRLSRQAQMVSASVAELKVCIVGVGGIGSNVAHLLASMGVQDITLIDPDTVREENIYPGFFSRTDLDDGLTKVDSVADELETRYGVLCDARLGNIVEVNLDDKEFDLVVVGTDSIASRRGTWELLRGQTRFWIDARMGGPGCDVYAVDVKSLAALEYEQTLNRHESPLACGLKATAFVTKGYVCGFVGDVVRDIVNEEPFAYHFRYDADDKLFLVESPDPENRNWINFRLNGGNHAN